MTNKRPTLTLAKVPAKLPEPTILFQLVLPVRQENGPPYHSAHLLLTQRLTEIAGGYTQITDVAKGAWVSDGKIVRELNIIYQVATTRAKFQNIMAEVLRLFPKEKAIFTAELGTVRLYTKEETQNARAAV